MALLHSVNSLAKGRRTMACLSAALLYALASSAPAQQRPLALDAAETNMFRPTIADVPPGVDHGNGSDDLPEQFQRRAVFYRSQHPVGTIIIETAERHLYLIESETRALRYGIGVGRDGVGLAGLLRITGKLQWPDWTPPPDLIGREPYLPRFMAGGPGNPLGARAMTLGKPTYRIHGTNAPETIGYFLELGCFRLVNEDVIDIYDRVTVGTRVIVRQN